MKTALWSPSKQQIASTLLSKFAMQTGDVSGRNLMEYDDLWEWSVQDKDGFWSTLWDFAGVIGEKGAVTLQNGSDVKNAKFFPQARLNYAQNQLRQTGPGDALVFCAD